MIWIPLCFLGCTWRWVRVFIMLSAFCYATTFLEAEENQNITVEWEFLSNESSPKSLNVYCHRLTDHRISLHYNKQGKHIYVHQDDEFLGRVWLDEDVLRERRIRLNMSRVRFEDSGQYSCTVKTANYVSSFQYNMKITLHIDMNATQTSYHAEKNHNVTLEWTFTSRPDCPQKSLHIFCDRLDGKVLFSYHHPESQDKQFSGRVHHDKDVLRERRIRLHVSRLKTEDSGCYKCKLSFADCWGSDKCNLSVTEPQSSVPHPTTVSHPPENRERTGLYFPLIAVVIIVAIFCYTYWKKTKTEDSERQPLHTRQTVSS